MNILHNWKKWMAVGCSHGEFIDNDAREAVLTFKEAWKPETTLHLGDFVDLAALRSGAVSNPNSKDRAQSISDDLKAGITFLRELAPQHILYGNHEARLFQFAGGPNALAAHAAQEVLNDLGDVAKDLNARVYDYNIRSYAQLGDTKFLHGYLYNVQAIRDHAETWGRCLIAHIHRTGEEQARNASGDTGYALGMLARFDMDYAATRRATLAWKQGFAYGHYNDKHCTVNIVSRACGQPWMLPI